MPSSEPPPLGIIAATVMQLRAHCPLLGGRVAGAANFVQGLEKYNTNMILPAAFVMPLVAESEGFAVMTGVIQYVTKTVAVVVEFPATPDRRGQQPAMDAEAMEVCINAAIRGWEPQACLTVGRKGYWLSGARVLDLDRARLFYQWEYGLTTQLDEADALEPASVPLYGIELDIWKTPPQDFPKTPGVPPPIITEINIETETVPAKPGWPPGPFISPATEEDEK
jgi:hypothetical protein